jgi:plasmid stabilization system protein ParE
VKYRVVVTAKARDDAVDAFRWLAERSPDAATRWYAGLEKAIVALEDDPKRHPIAEEESE